MNLIETGRDEVTVMADHPGYEGVTPGDER